MTVLITGGCGFLGKRLAQALCEGMLKLESGNSKHLTDVDLLPKVTVLDVAIPDISEKIHGVNYIAGSITDPAVVESALSNDVQSIFHLAAVLSGAAESDYLLGMKVNVEGTRLILDRCAVLGHCPRLVFASSVAVFSSLPEDGAFSEDTLPSPQSSYGTEKAIGELLVADASRRGFIDGRAIRLPTIVVRPGRPNSAASSFCSSIIREPLAGHPALCPVRPDLPLWIQSPRTVLENLVLAHNVALQDRQPRIMTMPGLTTTPREMVDALGRAGGNTNLVTWTEDPLVTSIVGSWPGSIATPRASSLGFKRDSDVSSIVSTFIEDYLPSKEHAS